MKNNLNNSENKYQLTQLSNMVTETMTVEIIDQLLQSTNDTHNEAMENTSVIAHEREWKAENNETLLSE